MPWWGWVLLVGGIALGVLVGAVAAIYYVGGAFRR